MSRSQRSWSNEERKELEDVEKGLQQRAWISKIAASDACSCLQADYFKPINKSTLIFLIVFYTAVCIPPLILLADHPWSVHHIHCTNTTVYDTLVGYDPGYVFVTKGYSNNPQGHNGPDHFIWEWTDREPWRSYDEKAGTNFARGTRLLKPVSSLLEASFACVIVVDVLLAIALGVRTKFSRIALQMLASAAMVVTGALTACINNLARMSAVMQTESWEMLYPSCDVGAEATMQRYWLTAASLSSLLLFFPLVLLLGSCSSCRWCLDKEVT